MLTSQLPAGGDDALPSGEAPPPTAASGWQNDADLLRCYCAYYRVLNVPEYGCDWAYPSDECLVVACSYAFGTCDPPDDTSLYDCLDDGLPRPSVDFNDPANPNPRRRPSGGQGCNLARYCAGLCGPTQLPVLNDW